VRLFKDTNYDFLRWKWHSIALSTLVIVAGLAVILTRGVPLGIEFAGGTSVIAQFEQPVSIDAVRSALNANYPGGGQDATINTYGDPANRQVMIRVPEAGEESGQNLSARADAVQAALRASDLGNFSIVGTEIVGPAVGEDLTRQGTYAMVLSLLGILAYIAFRFQFSFAVGAVVASIHDLLVTLAFLAFFQFDITLNVIAAILAVAGYSTNDTIVIFDRVRENARSSRRLSLNETINRAVNQTLGRTVLTAGTTLLSSIALFVAGGEVLRGFAFTMIVGVITGTYSSVFVAAAVVTFWKRDRMGVTAQVATPEQAATAARRKAHRKAKAS
jgi:preprotein translocase subunit SecF